jgi:exo-beta-1,3-glucanase (GH17 family)
MSKHLRLIAAAIISLLLFSCSIKDVNVDHNVTKVSILDDNWHDWAISYSGYRKGQDPRVKIYPTQEQVLEDLRIIEKNWKVIRMYGADQHTFDVLEIIKKEDIKLKVMLGIWLDGEPEYTEDNEEQVRYGIELSNNYSDIVVAINVGNESQVHWSDHKVPNDKLITYIKDVKSKVSVPVTTADTWDYWLDLDQSRNLVDAVDFIGIHIYPMWGGIDIDGAMSNTTKVYENLKFAIPNKKLVITEAGWATYTKGELHAPRAGDETKQKRYFNELMEWSEKENVVVFWFEAFDEPWKGKGTEGHWGLFTESRKAKKAMVELYPELITDEQTSPQYD